MHSTFHEHLLTIRNTQTRVASNDHVSTLISPHKCFCFVSFFYHRGTLCKDNNTTTCLLYELFVFQFGRVVRVFKEYRSHRVCPLERVVALKLYIFIGVWVVCSKRAPHLLNAALNSCRNFAENDFEIRIIFIYLKLHFHVLLKTN